MPLDPQAQAVIDAVNALGLPAVWEVTPEQARSQRSRSSSSRRSRSGRG